MTTPNIKKVEEKKYGYHITHIKKGELGKSSKMLEEIEELIDAELQGCKIMALVELSDLVGSLEAYLEKNYPTIKIEDLKVMSKITKRVFINGHRK